MPGVLILQHTDWCHWGLMSATSACTTHRQCRELILQLFCGYLQLWLIPSPHCFFRHSPMLCEGRELSPEIPVSLRDGDFGFLSQTPLKLGSRGKKYWPLRSKFCPNSAVFAETIWICHISPLLRVPKTLSGSTYHRRWLMLSCFVWRGNACSSNMSKSRTKDHTHETTRHTARQEFSAKKYHVQLRIGRKKARSKTSFPKTACNLKLGQKLKLKETVCEKKNLTNNCNFPLKWWNFLSLQVRKGQVLKKCFTIL